MKTRIHVVQGDITKLAVDVIVNAANPSLMGGGGVDGAIHRAGSGPAGCLFKSQAAAGRLFYGHAVITLAGDLPAKAVVHTVGPVWRGGEQNEDQLCRMPISIAYDWWRQTAIRQWLFLQSVLGFMVIPCGSG